MGNNKKAGDKPDEKPKGDETVKVEPISPNGAVKSDPPAALPGEEKNTMLPGEEGLKDLTPPGAPDEKDLKGDKAPKPEVNIAAAGARANAEANADEALKAQERADISTLSKLTEPPKDLLKEIADSEKQSKDAAAAATIKDGDVVDLQTKKTEVATLTEEELKILPPKLDLANQPGSRFATKQASFQSALREEIESKNPGESVDVGAFFIKHFGPIDATNRLAVNLAKMTIQEIANRGIAIASGAWGELDRPHYPDSKSLVTQYKNFKDIRNIELTKL
jgi:hypothetical protein